MLYRIQELCHWQDLWKQPALPLSPPNPAWEITVGSWRAFLWGPFWSSPVFPASLNTEQVPRPCILSPPLWGPLHPAAEAWCHAPCRLGRCQLPAVEFGRQLQGRGACSSTASPLMAWLQDGRPGWLSTNREMKNLSAKYFLPSDHPGKLWLPHINSFSSSHP